MLRKVQLTALLTVVLLAASAKTGLAQEIAPVSRLAPVAAFGDSVGPGRPILPARSSGRIDPLEEAVRISNARLRRYRADLADLKEGPLAGEARAQVLLARLKPMLTEEEWQRMLAGGHEDDDPSAWWLVEDAREQLLAWWRERDPLPATARNERLAEHLDRVDFALRNYSYDRSPAGYDDRGEVYVRFGRPAHIQEVEWRDPGRVYWQGSMLPNLRQSLMNVMGLGTSSFPPDNEVWFYDQVDRDAYYLFYESSERGRPYRAGEVKDFLPTLINQVGFPKSRRGSNRATAAYLARRMIYQQLSFYHYDFAARYAEAIGVAGDSPMYSPGLVEYAGARAGRDVMQDFQARRRRRKALGQERTSAFDNVASFDVAYRTARFLDVEDGSTSMEVYWAPRPGALIFEGDQEQANLKKLGYPAPRSYLLGGAVRAYDRVYESDTASTLRRATSSQEVAPGQTISTETFELAGRTGLFHLGLQFEQRLVRDGERGPLVRLESVRLDSLAALPPAAGGLAMSDLRPILLPRRLVGQLAEGKALRRQTRALAYPFDKILPSAPLALYFETYHLSLGEDDRTRYTVAYEVQRRTEAGGLRGLFGGTDQERAVTEAMYTGRSRVAYDVILIDLSETRGERGGELVLTVRVTDEVTGQTDERSLDFEIIEADE